jgi:hypothetical protein
MQVLDYFKSMQLLVISLLKSLQLCDYFTSFFIVSSLKFIHEINATIILHYITTEINATICYIIVEINASIFYTCSLNVRLLEFLHIFLSISRLKMVELKSKGC